MISGQSKTLSIIKGFLVHILRKIKKRHRYWLSPVLISGTRLPYLEDVGSWYNRWHAPPRLGPQPWVSRCDVRNPGVENVRVLDLGIQNLSTKILGCLPPPHSTWLKLIDMTIDRAEKYGTKKSKERREELFSPFFTFLRAIFFRPIDCHID